MAAHGPLEPEGSDLGPSLDLELRDVDSSLLRK